MILSQRIRARAWSASTGAPRSVMSGNMKPLETFELCGIDRKRAPVAALVSSSQAQRSSGYGLAPDDTGWKRRACSAPASVSTTRCRFAPPGVEVHSHPMRLVNAPGS